MHLVLSCTLNLAASVLNFCKGTLTLILIFHRLFNPFSSNVAKQVACFCCPSYHTFLNHDKALPSSDYHIQKKHTPAKLVLIKPYGLRNSGDFFIPRYNTTGKNNGLPFLDILGYLKNTHINPKFGKVRQVPTREFPTKFPGWDLSHSSKFGIFVGIL